MVSVDFRFNLKGDIDNWWDACNSSFMGNDWKMWIRPDLREKIVGVRKDKAERFLRPYLEGVYKREGKHVLKMIGVSKRYWDENETEIYSRLSKITKKPIWPPIIHCYYTTFPRCPYGFKKNEGWLYINKKFAKNKKEYAGTVLHELMHFQFHKYFWGYCKKHGLSDAQINHLKEAFTFLINEEFSDIVSRDNGYRIHKMLRKDLSKIWKKSNNFRITLDGGILLMKRKYHNLD
jgi:hypothetical protein